METQKTQNKSGQEKEWIPWEGFDFNSLPLGTVFETEYKKFIFARTAILDISKVSKFAQLTRSIVDSFTFNEEVIDLYNKGYQINLVPSGLGFVQESQRIFLDPDGEDFFDELNDDEMELAEAEEKNKNNTHNKIEDSIRFQIAGLNKPRIIYDSPKIKYTIQSGIVLKEIKKFKCINVFRSLYDAHLLDQEIKSLILDGYTYILNLMQPDQIRLLQANLIQSDKENFESEEKDLEMSGFFTYGKMQLYDETKQPLNHCQS